MRRILLTKEELMLLLSGESGEDQQDPVVNSLFEIDSSKIGRPGGGIIV